MKKVDLVLEGGGVKNIALLGAVTVLAEAGYTFPRVAGTSGGAIIAAGVAAYQKAGRDLGGLLDVSLRVDNSRFLTWRRPGRVSGPVSGLVDLLRRGGLHSGDYLYEFLCPALEDVGVRTFADLRIDDDPGSSLAEQQRWNPGAPRWWPTTCPRSNVGRGALRRHRRDAIIPRRQGLIRRLNDSWWYAHRVFSPTPGSSTAPVYESRPPSVQSTWPCTERSSCTCATRSLPCGTACGW